MESEALRWLHTSGRTCPMQPHQPNEIYELPPRINPKKLCTKSEERRRRYRPGFSSILYQVHPQHFLVDFSGTFFLFFCNFMLLCTVTTSTRTSIFLISVYYKNYYLSHMKVQYNFQYKFRKFQKIFISRLALLFNLIFALCRLKKPKKLDICIFFNDILLKNYSNLI